MRTCERVSVSSLSSCRRGTIKGECKGGERKASWPGKKERRVE